MKDTKTPYRTPNMINVKAYKPTIHAQSRAHEGVQVLTRNLEKFHLSSPLLPGVVVLSHMNSGSDLGPFTFVWRHTPTRSACAWQVYVRANIGIYGDNVEFYMAIIDTDIRPLYLPEDGEGRPLARRELLNFGVAPRFLCA
jgi:hypothetical protein